ncbi:MAG: hypothetical protein AAGM38_02860 [Pseudomonadota bacterium]
MKTLIIALTALTATVGAASAADSFTQRVPGYIFVKADRNNDGVLNKAEQRKAQSLVREAGRER